MRCGVVAVAARAPVPADIAAVSFTDVAVFAVLLAISIAATLALGLRR